MSQSQQTSQNVEPVATPSFTLLLSNIVLFVWLSSCFIFFEFIGVDVENTSASFCYGLCTRPQLFLFRICLILVPAVVVYCWIILRYHLCLKSGLGTVLLRLIAWHVAGWFIFHSVAILFGAPVINSFEPTLLWASIMSLLTLVPCGVLMGEHSYYWLLFNTKAANIRYVISWPTVGCVVGAWIGAFPIPLDWDRPWQAWPITCTYGAVIGYLSGLGLGILQSWLALRQGQGTHAHVPKFLRFIKKVKQT